MIETNIDDLSPQIVGHVMDRVFEVGALDCYFTPVTDEEESAWSVVVHLVRQRRERGRDAVGLYRNNNAGRAKL